MSARFRTGSSTMIWVWAIAMIRSVCRSTLSGSAATSARAIGEPLLVGGDRVVEVEGLEPHAADAVEDDHQVALPVEVGRVALGKPAVDDEALLEHRERRGVVAGLDLGVAHPLERHREPALPVWHCRDRTRASFRAIASCSS